MRQDGRRSFKDIEDFHRDRETRGHSREADCGVHWRCSGPTVWYLPVIRI